MVFHFLEFMAFQPFLRFYRIRKWGGGTLVLPLTEFQPFLRFYCLCVRLLWIFKFFFGFL